MIKLKSVEFTKVLNIGGYQAQRWADTHGWDIHLHELTSVVTLTKDGSPTVYISPAHWGTCEAAEMPVAASAPAPLTATTPEPSAPILGPTKAAKKRGGN